MNMTTKEKAKALVNRFYYSLPNNGSFTGINNIESRHKEAKQCALIAIDEIISLWNSHQIRSMEEWVVVSQYWNEVKKEIQDIVLKK